MKLVHRLHGRLIFLMLIALTLTGILALFFSSYAIDQTFIAYVDQQESDRKKRLASLHSILPDILAAYYEAHPNRSEINSIFEDLDWLIPKGILLTGPDGVNPVSGLTLPAGTDDISCETLVPVSSNGEVIGQVCFYPVESVRNPEEEKLFLDSIRRSLLWAVLASGAVALVLSVLFLRPVLRPLEALTNAVRKIERGEFPQKLDSVTIHEIKVLMEAFNAMSDTLHHTETLRRNLVSDVAHELRTPLTNLRGYLEALNDGLLKMTPRLHASLHEEVMLLSRLVDDLQDLALAEAGQLPIHVESTDVNALIGASVQLIRLAIQEKEIELRLDLDEKIPPVFADPERIGQVLRNLLANALAHTPRGGTITVRARNGRQGIEVRVNNSGESIATEHLPHVFDRFYRIDQSRTRVTGGSGLGLAIVKQLVEAHGGRVGVESGGATGTSFFFTLPEPEPA